MRPLDTLRSAETPEGVEIELRIAGAPVRFVAWFADTAIRFSVLVPVLGVLGAFGQAGYGIGMLVAFFGEWFYPVLCEVYWNGQTPGKRMMNLRVVRDDGAAVDWSASTLRNLLRFADFLPLGFLFGFVSILLTDESKRLGDLAAGTVVVHAEPELTRAVAPQLAEGAAAMPPVPLTLDEQAAVVEFAERGAAWTLDRQAEVADQLAGLTGDTGADGVLTLRSWARWLLGRRT